MQILLCKHLRIASSLCSRGFLVGCRAMSAVNSVKRPTTPPCEETKQDFTQIYKYPHIIFARNICRLKLFQTGFTVSATPLIGVLYAYDVVGLKTFTYIGSCSVLALCVLFVFGNFFRRFVGAMYMNSSNDILKIAHLTFFGRRRDVLVPVKDIVPFLDRGENPNNVYYTLERYSTGDKYFYIIKFGGILKPKEFQIATGVPIIPGDYK
ncbi:hypothetical protein CHUAL_002989 [Chamberlinius hualienensis]